jgi:uncharacterized protein (TIGR00290 family)
MDGSGANTTAGPSTHVVADPRDPVLLAWSGGKDSALALEALRADAAVRVEALITTVTTGYERVSMHGVRRALLAAQARAVGLPLLEARIPVRASNDAYEAAFAAALGPARASGVTRVAYGDLFLADVRAYRERQLGELGMRGLFPLWLRDTATLAREFIARRFQAVLVCVDPKRLDPSFAGRFFDAALLRELPSGVDPCGENGEFHTFVFDGPCFHHPVSIEVGTVVLRDGFAFCDLLPGSVRELNVLLPPQARRPLAPNPGRARGNAPDHQEQPHAEQEVDPPRRRVDEGTNRPHDDHRDAGK